MNVQHSNRSDLWYSPRHIMQLVHLTLGNIDIDPASDEQANLVVKADRIITAEQDALSMDYWFLEPSTVYCNPPGSKIGNKSKAGLFWDKLMMHWEEGLIEHAIFMGFSVEQLATTQSARVPMIQFPVCIPRKRIAFVSPNDDTKCAPSHSNCICYIPGRVNQTSVFKEVFAPLGGFITAG